MADYHHFRNLRSAERLDENVLDNHHQDCGGVSRGQKALIGKGRAYPKNASVIKSKPYSLSSGLEGLSLKLTSED